VGAGCEYLVIWARDGDYAHYDSKVLLKCPGLDKRDVVIDPLHVRLDYEWRKASIDAPT
jgi:hypothetical protein